MAHDVFISFSPSDKPIADAVCARLELSGIRCWVASRDILAGEDRGAAIVSAVEQSRVMVLVLSASANTSPQVRREVELAVNNAVAIVSLRVEDVAPSKSLELFLSTPHWLDAISPPLDAHLQYLAETVKLLLGQTQQRPRPAPSLGRAAPPPARWPGSNAVLAALAGAVVLAVLVAYTWLRPRDVESAVVGSWRSTGQDLTGDHYDTIWQITRSGDYKALAVFETSGTVEVRGGGLVYLMVRNIGYQVGNADAHESLLFDMSKLSASFPFELWVEMMTFSGTGGLSKFPTDTIWQSVSPATRERAERGMWKTQLSLGEHKWKITFEVDSGLNYGFRAESEESGHLFAKDGKWKSISSLRQLRDAEYKVIDRDSFEMARQSLVITPGPLVWRRSTR